MHTESYLNRRQMDYFRGLPRSLRPTGTACSYRVRPSCSAHSCTQGPHVRLAARLQTRFAAGPPAQHARGNPERESRCGGAASRTREVAARKAHLRIGGNRQRDASGGGVVAHNRRRADAARALQERRARHVGATVGRGAGADHQHGDRAAARQVGAGEDARNIEQDEIASGAGYSDRRRERAQGI